jgi:DNA-binding NtrC family response regulator
MTLSLDLDILGLRKNTIRPGVFLSNQVVPSRGAFMPLTCLIAAHDPWFIQLLRIYCEESGFRIVQVYEGQEVLPMIYQEKPVAVFMQADLPGKIKGGDVLRLIKSDRFAFQVPVLVFSWGGHAGIGEPAVEWPEGAAAYLQEPVTFDVFQDALRKAGIGFASGSSLLEPTPN